MPMSLAESQLFSLPMLLRGLMENAEKRIQLLDWLLIYRIHGDQLCVNRSDAVRYGGPGQWDTCPVTVNEESAIPNDPVVCIVLALLIQDLRMTRFAMHCHSELQSVYAVQLEAAVRRFKYTLDQGIYLGSGTGSGQISSLDSQMASANKILPLDTTNFYLATGDLPRLDSLVRADGPRIGVTSAIGLVNILKVLFDAGINPSYIEMPVKDSNGYLRTVRILTLYGIPIFVDDYVPTNVRLGTNMDGTTLYVFKVGRGGLYLVTSAGGSGSDRSTEAAVDLLPNMDVREEEDESTSVMTARITWPIALVLERQDAAASLSFRPAPGTS